MLSVEEKKKRKSASDKSYRNKIKKNPLLFLKMKEKKRIEANLKYKNNPCLGREISRINQQKRRDSLRELGVLNIIEKSVRKKFSKSISLTKRNWYGRNSESVKERSKLHRQTEIGRESKRHNDSARRAKSKETDIDRDFLIKLKKETLFCECCSIELNDENRHLDHILPLCIGGLHLQVNVRFICNSCNMGRPRKGQDLVGTKYEYMLNL